MNINAPTPAQISSLRALWLEAFDGDAEFIDGFFATAFSPARCRCVTDEDGRLLGALYWLDCSAGAHRFAYLYAIATAKHARGRGVCSTLMKHTHAHLADLGYDGALLVPSEPSLFGFYERLGYTVCSHVGELSCTASTAPIAMREISPDEYAALRRRYLPENGVRQEGESIALLATYARFFEGEDWLLAATQEQNALRGTELLGNASAAPAVTGALGYTEGIFRIPNGDLPFAMHFPLQKVAAPSYFGLAFD